MTSNKIKSKNWLFILRQAAGLQAIAFPIKSAEISAHFLAKTVGMAIS